MAKKIPLRQCIGCRQLKNKNELIRIVKSEDTSINIDITNKANGRGAYLCKNKSCFETARKNKGLERTFKMGISMETYDLLERKFEEFETR